MTAFTLFTGILTALALYGVWLNIKKNHLCFVIWMVTNASWAAVDFYKGIPMQGILFTIYTGLAVYGWWEWYGKETKLTKSYFKN